jgi:hypothetical protein
MMLWTAPKHVNLNLRFQPRAAARQMVLGAYYLASRIGLKFTMSSNFVGCSIGRSAGFAPLRMRSTTLSR